MQLIQINASSAEEDIHVNIGGLGQTFSIIFRREDGEGLVTGLLGKTLTSAFRVFNAREVGSFLSHFSRRSP